MMKKKEISLYIYIEIVGAGGISNDKRFFMREIN